ncbi:hypothetical protein C8Q79DRAFT_326254 [Trametes meyenii]|nr:hypothetical protein C8Q79DRAFT_326254 [Trametes meyenii]
MRFSLLLVAVGAWLVRARRPRGLGRIHFAVDGGAQQRRAPDSKHARGRSTSSTTTRSAVATCNLQDGKWQVLVWTDGPWYRPSTSASSSCRRCFGLAVRTFASASVFRQVPGRGTLITRYLLSLTDSASATVCACTLRHALLEPRGPNSRRTYLYTRTSEASSCLWRAGRLPKGFPRGGETRRMQDAAAVRR